MINVNDFQAEFGKRVKDRREQIGMTQEELAERLGYKHKTSVSKIEKGITVVPSSMVIKIAQALDVSVQQLMGREQINPITVTFGRDDEENALLTAWHQASYDEKMQIYYVLKKYGMTMPIEKDTIVISVS